MISPEKSLQVRLSPTGKKAAIEMSVGTIVTIVLLMTTLILGLVMVRTIFSGSIENINSIDQAVKSEINKLFAEDDARTVVIYPPTRQIAVKQGDEGGFGFSVRNTNEGGDGSTSFSYSVSFIESSCDLTEAQAENLIILGKSGDDIQIASGNSLDNPILVKFSISDNVPLCNVRYGITIENGGEIYGNTVTVDLKILPK